MDILNVSSLKSADLQAATKLSLGSLNTLASAVSEDSGTLNFEDMLLKALEETSAYETKSSELMTKLVTDPDSVNVDDVTIAMAEANLSLSLTKAIIDRAVKAYQEILGMS